MKVQIGEIRAMLEALPAVLAKELPVKTAYWLGRAAVQLRTEFLPFEDVRKKLVDKYGERDDRGELVIEGNAYKMTAQTAFDAEYATLATEEVEIKFEPITIEQLGDITLKAADIIGLGRLIKDAE